MTSTCDVPGCDQHRRRHQRLCGRCYARLPGSLRVAINEGHRQRRFPDWRAACREAGEYLNLKAARTAKPKARITPQLAFELQARLTGERVDL